MNIFNLMETFPDEDSCILHLEALRWPDGVACIHCGSQRVGRRNKNHIDHGWNCHDCRSTFSVTAQTMFHKTRIPLRKWFMGISIISNAKKSASSCQLARDLDMNQKTAWNMAMRIREKMSENDELLNGIVEVDETYVGGKPRNKGASKRGRGTKKTPVVGIVERGGRVVAQMMQKLTGVNLKDFILENASKDSILMTDEFQAYNIMNTEMKRHVINHKSKEYVDGETHTNTIESFWALLKRAFHGTHHHYSVKWLPMYVREACYKYNLRKEKDIFSFYMERVFC